MRKRINTPPPKKSSKKTLAPVPNKIPRTLLFVRHSDKLMLFFSIGLVLVRKYNYRGRVKVTQDSQRPSKEILRKVSPKISKEKRRFLVVVASGGLNQQRNQIVDAVVIARILEAALVVPILQVNLIWGDERIADAELNLGETEVREAHLAKVLYFIQIGDREKALEQLKVTESKTVAVRQKMDLVLYNDVNLFEEGGDWERKNRLKVYEGLYCMCTRNFKKAASLFLDSISTFTTYELFPYDTFIFYTVLTSIITLDRVSLKQKAVDAPEILTIIEKIPYLSEFLNSLYECQYKSFFVALVRTVVYSQFLESYKSVTIEAMTKAFGVTVKFIDLELSHFVLETNRPDAKNALYQATIKQGDFPLNRIEKLSRVIDL
uniref:O-fucosyltransferase family protein n=1 Tax=Quercus lobata TaxID=97700 RepID=A0A7N2MN83_QUELO